jgi:hypothetical protein
MLRPHYSALFLLFTGNNAGEFWLAPSPLRGESADSCARIGGQYSISKERARKIF